MIIFFRFEKFVIFNRKNTRKKKKKTKRGNNGQISSEQAQNFVSGTI